MLRPWKITLAPIDPSRATPLYLQIVRAMTDHGAALAICAGDAAVDAIGDAASELGSHSFVAPDYVEHQLGFADRAVEPDAARFDATLGEFLLPYEAVRTSADPEATLMRFLQSTYEAAADLAGWDRRALECGIGVPGVPRPVRAPE